MGHIHILTPHTHKFCDTRQHTGVHPTTQHARNARANTLPRPQGECGEQSVTVVVSFDPNEQVRPC